MERGGSDESLREALIDVVKACGGSKRVGAALWPAKGVEAAQRHLLACLNAERAEKLSLDEVVHIIRMGRERDCHAAMRYLCDALGYAPPQPVQPRDELAEMLREYLGRREADRERDERLQRLVESAMSRLGAPCRTA